VVLVDQSDAFLQSLPVVYSAF